MSDEEMNIDEGTFTYLSFVANSHLFLFLKWLTEVLPSGNEAVVFRVQQVCHLALHSALRLGSSCQLVSLSWQRRWRWVRADLRPRRIGACTRLGYPSGTM